MEDQRLIEVCHSPSLAESSQFPWAPEASIYKTVLASPRWLATGAAEDLKGASPAVRATVETGIPEQQ